MFKMNKSRIDTSESKDVNQVNIFIFRILRTYSWENLTGEKLPRFCALIMGIFENFGSCRKTKNPV
jgi:hypothetical protein